MIRSGIVELITRLQFNKWASTYDQSVWSVYFRKAYKHVFKYVVEIKPKDILDACCGTGELSLLCARANFTRLVVGIDISECMIGKAISKQKREGIPDQKMLFIRSSVETIPFPNKSFDMVLCLNAFHHFPKPNKVLREFNRVLRPDGMFIIIDPYVDGVIRKFWVFILKKLFQESYVTYHSKWSLSNLLNMSGFDILEQKSFVYFTLFTLCKK